MAEFKVVDCSVNYEGDEVLFMSAAVTVTGKITKDSQSKNKESKQITVTLDYSGSNVREALMSAARSDWIKLQKVRDRDDFLKVAEDLDGSMVHVSDIGNWTDTGKGRVDQVAAFLMKTGMERDKALEISKDPERRQKVVDWMSKLETPNF